MHTCQRSIYRILSSPYISIRIYTTYITHYNEFMNIKIVKDNIGISDLKDLAKYTYNIMIKGVLDVENEVIAFGGEYHIDANKVLIEEGFKQDKIWGFNIIFKSDNDYDIEYTSLINIRPNQNNFDMEIQDISLKENIKKILNKKIII